MQLRALRRARERTRIPLWPARFRCIPPRLLYSCSLGEYTARGRVPALALAFGSGSSGEAFSAVTLWQYLWRPAVTLASGSDSGALPLQASDTARGGVRRGGGGAGEDLPCHVGPQRDLRRHCPPRDWDGPDRERLCHHDLPPRPAGPELLDARSHEITRDHTRSHDPELLDAGEEHPQCLSRSLPPSSPLPLLSTASPRRTASLTAAPQLALDAAVLHRCRAML